MAETQLFYIGTSKIKEIRQGGSVTFSWGGTSGWANLAKPSIAKKEIKYKKSYKDGYGGASGWTMGGKTVNGTWIPATAIRTVNGVERSCRVRCRVRKYTKYTRTAKQKKKSKCTRAIHTYQQYQMQYEDKPTVTTSYSEYKDGMDYIYFADHYYDSGGNPVQTQGHLPHPVDAQLVYSDIHKNFDSSNANNSESRDNSGSFILANVRANVVTLTLQWAGLSAEQGMDLLDTLNPEKSTKGNYPYLVVQYLDPATGKAKNGTFFPGDRTVQKYPNGYFKEISVQLTEV